MNNILRLTTLLLLTSASGCLAVDEDIDELELRAGGHTPDGGSDCDCPDCVQQNSCWALAGHHIRVSIGADHIDEINDAGEAQLRAQLENGQNLRFTLRVVGDPVRIRRSISLKQGVLELPGGSGAVVMEIESMSVSEIESIAAALVAPRELLLVVPGLPDYVLPRMGSLTLGVSSIDP